MSLYLPDQKLGAHSQPDSSSQKFILKGRQTGGIHRGHSWVFRAESYDTMLAWYDDIKNLTEKTGEERNRFVRGHSRSFSSRSAASTSSFEDDEADQIPYSAEAAAALRRTTSGTSSTGGMYPEEERPQPGGRFPSDVQIRTDLPVRLSGSSDGSELDHTQMTTTESSQLRDTRGDEKMGSGAERNSSQSTPMDQKSLRDLEGAIYITKAEPLKRDKFLDKGPLTQPGDPILLQKTSQPPITDPHRSSAAQKATGRAINLDTSRTMPLLTNSSAHENMIQTSPETPISIPVKAEEDDGFRVHQSPERPVKTSTQVAAPYTYHSASIESYASQIPTFQPSATEKSVSFTAPESTEQEKLKNATSATIDQNPNDEAAPNSPGISRKNTDASISNFHVPGGFPRTPRTSII
jgi:hypothetical protein